MNQQDSVIFNGNKIPIAKFQCTDAFRAIMYGDGLFESILIDQNHIFLLELHLDRLRRGMNKLKLAISTDLEIDKVIENISDLIRDLPDSQQIYRLRILVWRSGLGKYTPENDFSTQTLLALEHSEPFYIGPIKKIGFSDQVTIYPNPLSNFKTLNGLTYVLASIEKKEKTLDELLLLNSNNEVVEGTSSNVFFVKNGILMTPKLSSGALDGVMRNYLIHAFKASNIKVMLKDISPEEAKDAELTLFCNSFSLRYKSKGNSLNGWIQRAKSFLDEMPKQQLRL